MWTNILICLLSSLLWRVRGGLKIKGHKIPLNKIWFALFYAGSFCYLTSFSWNVWAVCAIAVFASYQCAGWGEAVGCVLGGGKVSDRSDCPMIDDIVDNAKITYKGKVYKLTDYPVLFGWVWLSLRGLLSSFIMGLAFQNISYMLTGLLMGTVYWIGGRIGKIIPDGKNGWSWAEYLWGGVLYLCLYFCVKVI